MRETQIHAYSKGKASREKTLENRGEKNENQERLLKIGEGFGYEGEIEERLELTLALNLGAIRRRSWPEENGV